MKLSKHSDGIIRVEGKAFQKAFIKAPQDFYVNCPYCGTIIECGDSGGQMICNCGKRFWAEFSLPDILG